jgi:hypothetical protein
MLWPISLQGYGVLSRSALYIHIYLTVCVLSSDLPTEFEFHRFSECNYCLIRWLFISVLLLCLFGYWWPCRFTFGTGDPVGSHLHRIMCNISSLILSTPYFPVLVYVKQDATLHSLFYLETALHALGGTTTHYQERKKLYVQHLVFVTPLLLPASGR